MIQEEFVTFETAKLLREAGFPQDTLLNDYSYGYDNNFSNDPEEEGLGVMMMVDPLLRLKLFVLAPTQSVAMRWLREEKKLSVDVSTHYAYDWFLFECVVSTPDRHFEKDCCICTKKYEEAAELGIKVACEYLIKQKDND